MVLSFLFDDKRLVCAVLFLWLILVLSIFSHLGIWNTNFMTMGPSEGTEFMNLKLNTWYRWTWVAIFTFVSTTINDFAGDAIGPWINNTLQDHKTKYLPYSKLTCWCISEFWALYCSIMSIFSLFLMMSQIDFCIIRACADLVVNSYTTWKFIRNKKKSRKRYNKAWYHNNANEEDSESEDDHVSLKSITKQPAFVPEPTTQAPASDNV